ncbi:hypothetical protein EJB05_15866 [Eragrostis curvula]|uniref:Uncharacterized protein n=1 Tax=Eragrostis curvula TaxID=38414 RepID=A0A5J9VCM5_9POAL|nr:hypothetical protein EJB05_15866 [Eragrostis curvula]
MGREAAAATRPKLRRGLWSPEEDEKLYNHIIRYGVGCWSSVPKLAGLERCGKSCRLRWINYLRPDLKRGSFSQQEEDLIISLHKILGNRWSQIASQLPGRTDNEIKNFWNSCIKKKLRQRGIDPSTHKPLSEDAAAAAADPSNDDCKQQLPVDEHCLAIVATGSDPLAPHSPAVSFDPLSVTTVPAAMQGSSYGAAHSFRSDNLCDYGGVDVVSDAATYSAYTGGGDSSSNSNSTWTCGNVVGGGGGEPMPHMDIFGRDVEPFAFDPAKFIPWNNHQQQHHHHHDASAAVSFPIRSMSRDLPESCFDLARGALEDEFSVDFL